VESPHRRRRRVAEQRNEATGRGVGRRGFMRNVLGVSFGKTRSRMNRPTKTGLLPYYTRLNGLKTRKRRLSGKTTDPGEAGQEKRTGVGEGRNLRKREVTARAVGRGATCAKRSGKDHNHRLREQREKKNGGGGVKEAGEKVKGSRTRFVRQPGARATSTDRRTREKLPNRSKSRND